MQKSPPTHGDWRNGGNYEFLLGADRSAFAWEWLRRSPDYRAAAMAALAKGAVVGGTETDAWSWGLEAFEPPDLPASVARPMWCAGFSAHVLCSEISCRGGGADAFDLARFTGLARLLTTGWGKQSLLLSDGLRSIRMDVRAGSLAEGPVRLRYELEGVAAAERPLLTLRRFLALCRTGRFAALLHPKEARARRWIQLLRARDALDAGADQREIAVVLLSASARESRWRSRNSSLRSQAQRLVRGANAMAGGRWRELLR